MYINEKGRIETPKKEVVLKRVDTWLGSYYKVVETTNVILNVDKILMSEINMLFKALEGNGISLKMIS